MLTIKRVATMVSIQQNDDSSKGCLLEKKSLGEICAAAPSLPLYTFHGPDSTSTQSKYPGGDWSAAVVPEMDAGNGSHTYLGSESDDGDSSLSSFGLENTRSLLDMLVMAEWEDRSNRGLFRYNVTACETKTVPGEMGFVAQLNEGRHLKKRPTEFRVDQVLQDFDPAKFNFTKVALEELLFQFEERSSALGPPGGQFEEAAPLPASKSPTVVVINVSPIEYGHVLLVPRVMDRTSQRVDTATLRIALQFAAEADNPYFRVGYNSLGAFATINHLHFQAYYLNAPFAVERAPCVRVPGWPCSSRKRRTTGPSGAHGCGSGFRVLELSHFPVRGLVFEVGSSWDELAVALGAACEALQVANIPFNVLIAERGHRVFLFPQCYAERQARGEVSSTLLETQVNPAVWEISGHIVLKRREDYEEVTEEWACELLAQVSLSQEKFQAVKKMCLGAAEAALEAVQDQASVMPPPLVDPEIAEALRSPRKSIKGKSCCAKGDGVVPCLQAE